MTSPSDAELMRAVRAGHSSALGSLFERHHARLYRFCLRMVGNPHAAEDLVQEVFMRILKFSKTFRNDASFGPWMFRIARNACADHLRRVAREPDTEPDFDTIPAQTPTAESQASEHQRARLVERALARLPDQGREVLLLSRFEFKTYEEIGRVLGCSTGAVKVRAHRAMKQFREIFLALSQEAAT